MATLSIKFLPPKPRLFQGLGKIWAASLAVLACASSALESVSTPAGPDGPAQIAYVPAKSPAPAVILMSGQSGTAAYQDYAAEVAGLGYYAVLIDGKDILTRTQDGNANLKKTIERAQLSPHAVKGKSAVIAFSQGGGGALAYATGMADTVSMVVMHYPATGWMKEPGELAKRFKVPVLILTGERDRYNNNCCSVESMRAIEAVAKANAANFELVVYPQAEHGFNLKSPAFRRDDTADAWRRTSDMLRQYHPMK
jgi:dienelactone hydrolase